MLMQHWLLLGSKPCIINCINNVVNYKTVAFVYLNRKGAQTNAASKLTMACLCIAFTTHILQALRPVFRTAVGVVHTL